MKRLEEDFLDNVFHFAFPSRVTTGGGEDARLVFFQQGLETGGVATQHGRNQFRVGSFHSDGIWHRCRKRESGKPPRERGGFPVNPNQPVPESFGLPPAEVSCLSADRHWRIHTGGRQENIPTFVAHLLAHPVCARISTNIVSRRRDGRPGYSPIRGWKQTEELRLERQRPI